jgi:hypothetical protein
MDIFLVYVHRALARRFSAPFSYTLYVVRQTRKLAEDVVLLIIINNLHLHPSLWRTR